MQHSDIIVSLWCSGSVFLTKSRESVKKDLNIFIVVFISFCFLFYSLTYFYIFAILWFKF